MPTRVVTRSLTFVSLIRDEGFLNMEEDFNMIDFKNEVVKIISGLDEKLDEKK